MNKKHGMATWTLKDQIALSYGDANVMALGI
jgi:hypothetical protein